MDDLAVKLGMDPLEFRLKNDPNEIRQREYKLGAEKFGWKQKYQKPGSSPGVVKTGVGCAGAAWPAGAAQAGTRKARRRSIPTAASNFVSACRTSAPARARSSPSSRRKCSASSRSRSRCASATPIFRPAPAAAAARPAPRFHRRFLTFAPRRLQQLQTQSGVADARGENWFAACKKLGVNPLVVHGQWQQGFRPIRACGVQFAEVDSGHGNRFGHGEKNRRRPRLRPDH